MLVGEWLQEQQLIHIITIYSPCDIQNKRILWDNVKQLKYQSQEGLWCVLGDFITSEYHQKEWAYVIEGQEKAT